MVLTRAFLGLKARKVIPSFLKSLPRFYYFYQELLRPGWKAILRVGDKFLNFSTFFHKVFHWNPTFKPNSISLIFSPFYLLKFFFPILPKGRLRPHKPFKATGQPFFPPFSPWVRAYKNLSFVVPKFLKWAPFLTLTFWWPGNGWGSLVG